MVEKTSINICWMQKPFYNLPVKWSEVLVAQSCPTLCDPMDYSPPGSSVHGSLQVRIREWVAIPFSRGSSQPKDWTRVSCLAGRFFTTWTMREAPNLPIRKCKRPSRVTYLVLMMGKAGDKPLGLQWKRGGWKKNQNCLVTLHIHTT